MSPQETLFIETTIHGERIFGEKARSQQIQNNLKNKRVCTSTFVLNEFKHTFLESVIIFHNLLVDPATPDIQTALRRVSSHTWKHRVKSRVIAVFATLCDEGKNDKEAALERLESWIEDDIEVEFHNNIEEPILDGTACKWLLSEPCKVGKTYEIKFTCRKDNPPACSIEKFWKRNKKELGELADSSDLLSSSDKDLKKLNKVAKLIHEDSDKPYGQNCNIFLSDALIATEAPKGSMIYTTNKKHFEPICKIIKKRTVYKEV